MQVIDITAAAQLIGISRRRVHQLVDGGLLREVGRAGGVRLLCRSDVERLAREGWPGRRAGNSDGGVARDG